MLKPALDLRDEASNDVSVVKCQNELMGSYL